MPGHIRSEADNDNHITNFTSGGGPVSSRTSWCDRRVNDVRYRERLELVLFASPERLFLLDDIIPSFRVIVSPESNLRGLGQKICMASTDDTISRCGPLNLALITLGISKIWLYISRIMKTLVIHPEDKTTEFLTTIYANLNNKTVIKGGVSKSELQELIESHDRVLMLGHGSPDGLLSRGQFPEAGLFIVDDSMVSALKNKSNGMYIWCHADKFVQKHGLSGLCSGMFISEVGEAYYYGFHNIDYELVAQSNERFSFIISKYLNEPMEVMYQKLVSEYKLLAKNNPVARFNLERLHLSYSGTISEPFKVVENNT